ncbi:hypothetical protein CIB84_015508 [Bambusicola thoracicus]|uniref:Uncharacterized protein n=1 Tax=Bambusicola thoracicus TaxID=9083 RepID=A0A2P4S9F4_BAMTH|nr:hypothetical protein CIB84_015508 [Bambusicola thoracicus]
MPRMWVQNNVQEKNKKMYPFTKAIECNWGTVGTRCVRKLKMRVIMQESFKAKNEHLKLP